VKRLSRVLARVLLVLCPAAGVGVLLTARALYEGERELRTAEALSSADKLEDAALHARAAAAWYLPGAPHVPAAYARLIAMARVAEGRGDPVTALYVWRSVRAAALSSRWARIPHGEELALANASIARLAAQQPQPQYARIQDPGELQQQQHVALAQHLGPRLPWVITMLLGCCAMCVGMVYTGRQSFNAKNDRFEAKRLWPGAVVASAGLLAWAAALYFG
jgi:hypothetical protein